MLAAQFLDMYGRSNEGMTGRKLEERSEGPVAFICRKTVGYWRRMEMWVSTS